MKTQNKATVADKDEKIASIMGMRGASADEASRTLDECGGNYIRAMAQLYKKEEVTS